MRRSWLVNPATVTPFAAAVPAAAFMAAGEESRWLLASFGMCFMLSLLATILWLPLAGPALHRLPGGRFSLLAFSVGGLVTALVAGMAGMLLLSGIPKLAAGTVVWLGAFRYACVGGYFGLIATGCLYVDPGFRASRFAP